MRARNREINIFNMSLLDILTGMLGAFLFLMIGLVPYYAKVMSSQLISAADRQKFDELKKLLDKGLKGPLSPEEAEQLKNELNRLGAQNQQLQNTLAQTKQDLQAMTADRDDLRDKVQLFVNIMAQWPSEKVDMDIFLIDHNGGIFGPKAETLLGKKVTKIGADSHGQGQAPRDNEYFSVSIEPNQKYFVVYRVPAGASPADYSDLHGWLAVNDDANRKFSDWSVGYPDNILKAQPGKLNAWFSFTYDKSGLHVNPPQPNEFPKDIAP